MRVFLIATFLAVFSVCANATTIEFEEFSGQTPSPIVTQGFKFTASDDSFFQFSSVEFDSQALYFCPNCTLTIEDELGDAFSLNGFLFNTALDYGKTITVTGLFQGGGSISTDLTVNFASQWFEFDTAWTNLSSVVIDGNELSIGNGIDHIVLNEVPIPAAVWLFGSALAGLGWIRRKQIV